MVGALRVTATVRMVLGLLVLAAGLVVQRAQADQPIQVQTRAEVVGAVRVTVDIEPGSNPNSINLPCRGDIPVAILTTAEFDAATVDPGTVTFAEATVVHPAMEDVDGDGDLDLVLYFKCQEVSIPSDATQACLEGITYEDVSIEGCDSVRMVPPGRPAGGGPAAAKPTATPALAGAIFAPTAIGTPPGGPAAGGTLTATPELAGAVFTPTPIGTPSPGSAAGGVSTATPRSKPVFPPPSDDDGDLETDSWPWLVLLAGGGLPVALLMVGLVWFRRPRRR
jgi:hypothetical protein